MRATTRFTAFSLATVLAIASLVALSANAQQAPKLPNLTPAQIDQRADALVKQMTLEEKIDLLGGSGIFKTTPLARINIPAFLMSDGPVGAHIPPPATQKPWQRTRTLL
jgi:beta-glucosidase